MKFICNQCGADFDDPYVLDGYSFCPECRTDSYSTNEAHRQEAETKGLLSYTELIKLIDQGVLQGVDKSDVNATSIDLTLGDVAFVEDSQHNIVDLAAKETPVMVEISLTEKGHAILPGGCVLTHTKQVFNLPNNISAEYKLNSSLARCFLDHLNAGWCGAGWNESTLTLELKNLLQFQTLLIKPGMKCGQVNFFRHTEVPEHASYVNVGQYNGDKSVSQSKGLRQSEEGKEPGIAGIIIRVGDTVRVIKNTEDCSVGEIFKTIAYDPATDTFFCKGLLTTSNSLYIPTHHLEYTEITEPGELF